MQQLMFPMSGHRGMHRHTAQATALHESQMKGNNYTTSKEHIMLLNPIVGFPTAKFIKHHGMYLQLPINIEDESVITSQIVCSNEIIPTLSNEESISVFHFPSTLSWCEPQTVKFDLIEKFLNRLTQFLHNNKCI